MTGREGPAARATRAIELAGFCSFLVALGLGRFGYPPLIPVLVASGTVTPATAGSIAAANFAGYLAGAALAEPLARRLGALRLLAPAMALIVIGFAASALPWGSVWLMGWRALAGFGGGVIMVVGTPTLLGAIEVERRGVAGGRFFAGVGIGILLAGVLLPALPGAGPATLWLALAALSGLAALTAWRLLPKSDPLAAAGPPSPGALASKAGFGKAYLGLAIAYGSISIAYVPHTVFWVDFLARSLGAGLGAGGTAWMLLGIGALAGTQFFGWLADRIGFRASLRAAMLGLGLALSAPLLTVSPMLLTASSLLAGACSLGSVSLTAGRCNELVAPERRRRAWAILTVLFAVGQSLGAFALTGLLGATHDYGAVFWAAGAALALGLLADGFLGREVVRS